MKDYANALDDPPMLVVSDRLAFEIAVLDVKTLIGFPSRAAAREFKH